MSKKPKDFEEILLKARSSDGRRLRVVILPENASIEPAELVARLNGGSLEIDGCWIIDRQLNESVAEIESNSYDASATEYRNFALSDESFEPLDEVTDTDLLKCIDGLRGLIDGEQDGLGEVLTIPLGFLLAERAKRERQRRSDED
jgi:hypothetical protein